MTGPYRSPPTLCEHEAEMPGEPWPGDDAFQPSAGDMFYMPPSVEDVRRRWPRGSHCKKCGEPLIGYHSKLHYVLGDW